MSQDRTEKPTEKKRKDARKKGNVAYSTDASAAIVFFIGFLTLLVGYPAGLAKWTELIRWVWSADNMSCEWDLMIVMSQSQTFFLDVSLPVVVPAALAGVLVGYLQVGPLYRPLNLDVTRMSPIRNIRSLFSIRKCSELLKSFIKLCLIFFLVAFSIMSWLPDLLVYDHASFSPILDYCQLSLIGLGRIILMLVLGFGLVDYFFQRYWWLRELRMTHQEVRQEHKDAEGDPIIKGMRKQAYQDMSFLDFSERVSTARMIVVNPTHYAIAIQYDEQQDGAPRVVAKGYLEAAVRIRSIAGEMGVPVLRHPPLARRLYELPIDQEIPADLFEAVAELLIYLIRMSESELQKCR